MRQLVPVLAMFALAACTESHRAIDDASVDGSEGCTGSVECVQSFGHVCGDAFFMASCIDGAWQCPGGTVPNGEAECWCYGGAVPPCECTPSGWSCPVDAGVPDGGGCPADPTSAEGTPCAEEGASCGRCTDPCGFCNLLRCEGGVWTRLEAYPPPGPCLSFECGADLRCDAFGQYCEHGISDVGGEPDSYRCVAYPEACSICECLPGNECAGERDSGITVTFYGG